ncbi:MAG: hypothetical protein A2845_01250 [Candidatus Lloydbacteria bacterium RIFCSPHIGHO2_01_FULL_49_22]|uniref:Arginase n=1 Tax=Candidatus Lloydbacteria bacterium RIFCSPHIGHO2_01_FULL_49_22 TaxID=1798658 RepID=A0A1G2CYF7_9BACT|nr:MAG: hypothetical protein A2845_01250 [Candidatus Lloydbacteria bacterium RIFCSPHIGHO2_01_FULL_49_22]OGZ09213.1 MAG: hypothetical protein A3C14_06060 [Candidatus Lloydbacteria bacterium RIFCSPHIGHO2_02_FULL_50_18]
MKRPIEVIGVPFAQGGSKGGSANGPRGLIENGLLDFLETNGLTSTYTDVQGTSMFPEIFSASPVLSGPVCSHDAVLEVAKLAGARVFAAHTLGRLPLVIGGDHSISLGTVPQFLDPVFSHGRKVGLIWLDAHYDAHTPKTSHSHFANGFPLASALGYGERTLGCYGAFGRAAQHRRLRFRPEHVLHLGAGKSDCEPEELALLQKLNVKTVTMTDVNRGGYKVLIDALDALLCEVDDVIFTFDLDAMHKKFVPGVSFQSTGGLFPWHAFKIADRIATSGKLRQIEIVEYNPDAEEYTDLGYPKTVDFVLFFLERLLH